MALEQSGKPGVEKLAEHFRGMPAMLFSKDNPFTLFKILKKSKSPHQ
jgi:ribosomal protein L10